MKPQNQKRTLESFSKTPVACLGQEQASKRISETADHRTPNRHAKQARRCLAVGISLALLIPTIVAAQPNIVAWGNYYPAAVALPARATNIVAIDGGQFHTMALRNDGRVVNWGDVEFINLEQANISNFVAIACAGADPALSLGVRANGRTVMYDDASFSYRLSGSNYVDASVDYFWQRAFGLTARGEVRGAMNEDAVVLTNITAMTLLGVTPVGLRQDGTLVRAVESNLGQFPNLVEVQGMDDIVSIDSKQTHVVALRENGTVVSFGNNSSGQTNVPPGLSNVIAVAGGWSHSLALKADGTVVGWGDNTYGQTNVPTSLSNVVAIGCGVFHSFAVTGEGPPFLTAPLTDRAGALGGKVYFRIQASGQRPLSYQWRMNGTNLPGATNQLLTLTNLQAAQAGLYSVVVANALGTNTSREALLATAPFFIKRHPVGLNVALNGTTNLAIEVQSFYPTFFQWRFNGADLAGQTNATLTFSNANFSATGDYSVTVSNAYGRATSAVARVVVRQVVTWAESDIGAYFPEDFTNVMSVALGDYGYYSGLWKAVTEDGRVVDPFYFGPDETPGVNPAGLSNVVAVTAGYYRTMALKADGTVAEWGNGAADNRVTSRFAPQGLSNVVAIASSIEPSVGWEDTRYAIQADGNVVTWGFLNTNFTNLIGVSDFVGVQGNGTVVSLFPTTHPLTNAPAGLTNILMVDTISHLDFDAYLHSYHFLALRDDGQVVAWGKNSSGATNVPAGLGDVISVAAGRFHSMALRRDGEIFSWGGNYYGETNVPPDARRAVAVATGASGYNLAVIGYGPPKVLAQTGNFQGVIGGQMLFKAQAAGQPPLYYQWRHNGTNLPGATNAMLVMRNTTAANSGHYTVAVSNSLGTTVGGGANLQVLALTFPQPPLSSVGFLGGSLTLRAQAFSPVATSLQWRFNGVDIPGANTATLTLSGLTAGQQGSYTLVASNQYGRVESPPANVAVANVAAWGECPAFPCEAYFGEFDPLPVPAELSDAVGIAASYQHALAVRRNGTVTAWGRNCSGQTAVPADLTNAIGVAAGQDHSLALLNDGTIRGWGANFAGQATPPPGLSNVIAIAAGFSHSVALQRDGKLAAWGYYEPYNFGQTNIPPGLSNVTAIAAGSAHTLALRTDGTVVAWGRNSSGETNVPANLSNVVAVAAGYAHSLALKSDGTVVGWGANWAGQTDVPAGLSNVIAIAAGEGHSLALLRDRTVVAWGDNYYGQTYQPAGLSNVVAIAAGGTLNLAIMGNPPSDRPTLGLRASNGLLVLTLAGPPNQILRIEASSNLVNWVTVAQMTNYTGTLEFATGSPLNHPARFYRAVVVGVTTQVFALREPAWQANGDFHFSVLGPPGRAFRVEGSTDLVHWSTISIHSGTGTLPISIPASPGLPDRFFRAAAP